MRDAKDLGENLESKLSDGLDFRKLILYGGIVHEVFEDRDEKTK